MVDLNYIIENSKLTKREKISGVYFLIAHKRIVYIGSSLNVMGRIETHKKNLRMHFNKYYIYTFNVRSKFHKECKELRLIEKFYIKKYKPLWNFKDNPDYDKESNRMFRSFVKNFSSCWDVASFCNSEIYPQDITNALRNPEKISPDKYDNIKNVLLSRFK